MQLAAANDAETTRERYMEIVAAKTAALFAAAARSGAVAAGREGPEATALEAYGRELGLAFQLVDDALDYGGASATMGKNAGDDFREGKVTLPVIFARDAGDDGERAFWRRVVGGERTDDDFHRAVALVTRHDALALTLDAAREHAARARDALKKLPANAYREALEALPEFVVERAY
jgi:octaprenyl-diphosphate synthase